MKKVLYAFVLPALICAALFCSIPFAAGADYSETFTVHLNIDNDGIEEIIDYLPERNVLRIRRSDRQLLLEVNLDDYGIYSDGFGMGTGSVFFEFVRDSESRIYFYTYTSSFIGDGLDGERYTSATENYYDLKNHELTVVDTIRYTWVWDGTQPESQMTDIYINGQSADSLDSIKSKYTIIENTHFEIP